MNIRSLRLEILVSPLRLCLAFLPCLFFAGCGSGYEWRRWDGAPSGYEGLLTEQFGLIAVAIDRYRVRK